MRRLVLGLALSGVFFVSASAQNVRVAPYGYQNVGYCQMTSVATAKTMITSNCASGAIPTQHSNIIVEICAETQGIRYRADGTAPTASVGVPLPAGSCFQWSGNLDALQVIQQASSATVDLDFYE